jgi:hypothetical protein
MIVSISPNALDRQIGTAWKGTTQVMGREFRKAIVEPTWNWPRGESPRDIVDTGALRNSQQMRVVSRFAVQYSWTTPYAQLVHNGARLRSGTFLPARPWTQLALSRQNPIEVFTRLMAVA